MPYPDHNKERFFKYTNAKTAVLVLETSAVRYSSPLLFNDPFDAQSGLHFDFDIQSFPDRLLKHIQQLVSSNTIQSLPANSPWGEAIRFLHEKRITHGPIPNDLWNSVHSLIDTLKDQMIHLQTGFKKGWHDYLPRVRVFSVAEEKDNLLMWSHYAESHTGVVFEFMVLPQEDNPLCVARPILYSKSPPSLFTEQQWMDDILDISPLDLDELYFRYAYVKSNIWAYEKEWRVWDLIPEQQEVLYSEYPLREKEIAAVYLGCKISPDDKTRLVTLMSQKQPHAKIFQARKASEEFRLDFETL
jgi:hypothetical protein